MAAGERRRRVVVLGAGGRDFHNFNILFRDDPAMEVVAFTATQIPFQAGRRYPAELAGPLYPHGIPIVPEEELAGLIAEKGVEEVLFAYSDISHEALMRTASGILALGPDLRLAGPEGTMLQATIPVISVCAVRTGCGKSPVTRHLCRHLLAAGRRPVVVRHPMAYGRLDIRAAEALRSQEDLDRYQCTLEEREEFEPLIAMRVPLFAGVDYRRVLALAEAAGDVLLWDGGNNDFPFVKPDLEIVLADPFRPGHEISFYPGMVNLLRAHVVVLAKAEGAPEAGLAQVRENVARFNPRAVVAGGGLEVVVDKEEAIRGKRVAVIEDGPTLTHGGMSFGAGVVAARRFGAAAIVDPRPFARGSLARVFLEYPHLTEVVPAMGYSEAQLDDLRSTLRDIPCDLIVSATPIDLEGLMDLSRPMVQVKYEYREGEDRALEKALAGFLAREGGG